MIELVGKSIKEGRVGGSRDGGIDNGEGDRTIVVDKNFEADSEAELTSLKTEAARSGERIRIRSRSGLGAAMFLRA